MNPSRVAHHAPMLVSICVLTIHDMFLNLRYDLWTGHAGALGTHPLHGGGRGHLQVHPVRAGRSPAGPVRRVRNQEERLHQGTEHRTPPPPVSPGSGFILRLARNPVRFPPRSGHPQRQCSMSSSLSDVVVCVFCSCLSAVCSSQTTSTT